MIDRVIINNDAENYLTVMTGNLYDAEGRLIATAGTQYEYNAGGERVSKDNAAGAPQTLYLHDGDGNQIAELNAALAVQHVNVYSGKHLVGTWNPASGQVYYAYSDWLGTKRYEADGGGNYVNSWASLPFGDNQTALGAGLDATEHHFTGQERDAESGLDHFAARYYQSQTGRWLLPDWSATPVPVPYAAFTNPQSLNLYTYMGNNPVNALDADGHVEGGGVSTYTAQQGSALWQCVHAAPGNGNTDGCDFGAWGVDDGGVQPQAEDATQAALDQTADQKNSNAQAQQQNTNGGTPPSGGSGNAINAAGMKTLMSAADKFAAACASVFSSVIPNFSLSTFDSEMHNATYNQYPVPYSGPEHSASTEADTKNTGPMRGRFTNLFANFFRDTSNRQAAIFVHENLHRSTGWTDSTVFYMFQNHGMRPSEINDFKNWGSTDGITTWILRGCQ
jgi:RHS repeat-associated protein